MQNCKSYFSEIIFEEAGEEALSLREKLEKEKVRIVGMDTTTFKVKGKKLTVAFLTDLIKGEPVEIEIIKSRKAGMLKRRFQKLLKDLGAEVIVTDDAEETENLRDVGRSCCYDIRKCAGFHGALVGEF